MPLYFPRNKEEEDFALNELPDDIGEMKLCFVCVVIWTELVFSWEETFQTPYKPLLGSFNWQNFHLNYFQKLCYL